MRRLAVKAAKEPSIFTHTTYRLPTDSELQEFSECNLSAKQVIDGFSYTIIGRGIKRQTETLMILEAIKMLCNKFPENLEYHRALNLYKSENNLP